MIAAAVVAVLLAAMLLTSGGGGEEDDAEAEAAVPSTTATTTSTTDRRTRQSIVRRTTTTTLPRPISTQPLGARLAVARDGELALVDVDANAWSLVPIETLSVDDAQPGMLIETLARRGDHLVFQGPDGTYAASLTDPGVVRMLAPSIMFVSASAEDEVWVVQPPVGGPATVQRFNTNGGAASRETALPVDWMPVGAVERGLVLRRGSRFQVWDPATGTASFTSEPDVNVLDARGRMVAWQVHCDLALCSLHLTDTVTGTDRPVFLDRVQIDWGRSRFSPDGRHLIAHAHRVENQRSWRPGLLVVDVGAATSRFVELTRDDLSGGSISWSPDGRWAFVLAGQPTGRAPVLAFSPDGDQVIELDLPSAVRGSIMAAY